MPIYAYKCASCGHAKDVLQKMSDAPLAVCPACGASTFEKQLTAAGFQLKGSGWYATDFRNGSKPPAAEKGAEKGAEKAGDKPAEGASEKASEKTSEKGAEKASSDTSAPAKTETAAPAPAPAAKPAAPGAGH
jgi:putative FmdB family regulatory protein